MNKFYTKKLDFLLRSINDYNEGLLAEYKELMPNVLKVVFDGLDESIQEYSFTAYTPYFNDGDPCVYSVHFYPFIHVENDVDPEIRVDDEIREFIDSIPTEIAQSIFDEGRIIVSRDGSFRVEELDHD